MMSKAKANNVRLIGIIVLIGIFVFSVTSASGSRPFSISGSYYTSAFEGPKASFLGVKYNNQIYTPANTHGASATTFDTTINFDVDGASSGKPNINGQMTAIYLPADTMKTSNTWLELPWIPQQWFADNAAVVQDPEMGMAGIGGINPPWSWNLTDNNGVENTYIMKEFDMKFWVSFTSTCEGSEDPKNQVPWSSPFTRTGYAYNVYNNLDVWIHIDIAPTWYIEGGGTGYFAIAEMTLDQDVIMKAKDNNGQVYDARTNEKVDPVSEGAIMSLYYSQFGASSVAPSDISGYQYKGKDLNPQYFTSDLYFPIHLNDFGTWSGAQSGTGTYTRGDVATFAFDLKVFVFGEYRVQDIQQNNKQFGETTPTSNSGIDWFTGIVDWLSNPANVAVLIVVLILVLIIIFAPWVLIAIIAIFSGHK